MVVYSDEDTIFRVCQLNGLSHIMTYELYHDMQTLISSLPLIFKIYQYCRSTYKACMRCGDALVLFQEQYGSEITTGEVVRRFPYHTVTRITIQGSTTAIYCTP